MILYSETHSIIDYQTYHNTPLMDYVIL